MNLTRSSHDLTLGFQATLVDAGYGQLLLRDAQGRVAQRWTMTQPKCILGASSSCQVCSPLPGIVDQHVLLVIGVKQVFLKALASEVKLNGVPITEFIHTDDSENLAFEIAGHHFEFQRYAAASSPVKQAIADSHITSIEKVTAAQSRSNLTGRDGGASANDSYQSRSAAKGRLRFTVVRALEKQGVQPFHGTAEDSSSEPRSSNTRPAWVEEIVRDALRPVELQLESMQEPMHKLERELRRQMRRRRKQKQVTTDEQISGDRSNPEPQESDSVATNPSQHEIRSMILEQSNQLQAVQTRVSEITSQLSTLENLMTEANQRRVKDSSHLGDTAAEILQLQQEVLSVIKTLHTQSLHAQPDPSGTSGGERPQWRLEMENRLRDLGQSLTILGDLKSQIGSLLEENRELARAWESRGLQFSQGSDAVIGLHDVSSLDQVDSRYTQSSDSTRAAYWPSADSENAEMLASSPSDGVSDLPSWWSQESASEQTENQLPPSHTSAHPTAWDRETQPGRSEFAPDYAAAHEASAENKLGEQVREAASLESAPGSSTEDTFADRSELREDPYGDELRDKRQDSYRRDLSDDALSVITNNAFGHDEYSPSAFSSDDLALPSTGLAGEGMRDHQEALEDDGYGEESWQAGVDAGQVDTYQSSSWRNESSAPDAGFIDQDDSHTARGADLDTEDYAVERNEISVTPRSGSVSGYIEGQTSDITVGGGYHSSSEALNRASTDSAQEESEESVEEYMRRLLARMRGVSEDEVTLPILDQSSSASTSTVVVASKSLETERDFVTTSSDTEKFASDATEPFDPESYVPRGAAAERNRDLDALRELANSSARIAINVSARRKHGTDILIKAAVACVGLAAGSALVAINGFNPNIALIATVAAFIVALVWGYDAIATLKPLLQSTIPSKQTSLRSYIGSSDDDD